MDRGVMNKKMSQIIAKAWSNENFKTKLIVNPAETLRAEGIEIPDGVKVKALENTAKQFFFVIPNKPDELSDEDLGKVAAGWMCKEELLSRL